MYSTAWFTIITSSVAVRDGRCSRKCHTAVDSIGLLVGDLNAELLYWRQSCFCISISSATNLLNSHNNLDGVQAVKSKIVGEVCGGGELLKLVLAKQFEGSEPRRGVGGYIPLMRR